MTIKSAALAALDHAFSLSSTMTAAEWQAKRAAIEARPDVLFEPPRAVGDLSPQMKAAGDSIIGSIRSFVTRAIAARMSKVDALEKRIEALETKPNLKYRGVWNPDEDYEAGDLVTDGGALHHCWSPTRERPGSTADWQLCQKRGKDSR